MKKIFVTFISLLFGIVILAQNSAGLKLNLEKNKVYRLASSSEQTITQTINGIQQTTESKSGYAISIKMIDATPDFIITEMHLDTIETYTNAMGKISIMTSKNEGDIKSSEMTDVISSIMNRLSKNAVYVKMDFSGKPLEIINAKMLESLILKDTSDISLTGPIATGVKTQIVNMLSENSLKTMIKMFTWVLPGKEVTDGAAWNISDRASSGGMDLDINTSYKLDRINGNEANVTAESEIKAAVNANPIISGGARVTYDDLKGISKSTMVIDTKTGLVSEVKSKTYISGNLGITAPGVTMQMPMEINGTASVVGLK